MHDDDDDVVTIVSYSLFMATINNAADRMEGSTPPIISYIEGKTVIDRMNLDSSQVCAVRDDGDDGRRWLAMALVRLC